MNTNTRHLLIIGILYFNFGFITNINEILIPYFKNICKLTDFQSGFVQFAFFGAYFLVSLPASQIINWFGYKKSISLGLLVAGLGAVLFVVAAGQMQYGYFLAALAVLASGITILQVAANPYVSLVGPLEGASGRMSLMGGINSLGATLAPYIGGLLFLAPTAQLLSLENQAATLILPYSILAFLLVSLAVFIRLSPLPEIVDQQAKQTDTQGFSVFQYPKLVWGIVAIFCYVGAEVGVASFLIRLGGYLKPEGFTLMLGAGLVATYWFLSMVARFAGVLVLRRWPNMRVLALAALCASVLCVVVALGPNGSWLPLYAAVAIGFFNSIMWPVIFPKAIEGLGRFSSKGSSLLIMGVVGGALMPLAMGAMSDDFGTSSAYLLPLISYIFIFIFALKFNNK